MFGGLKVPALRRARSDGPWKVGPVTAEAGAGMKEAKLGGSGKRSRSLASLDPGLSQT